MKELFTLLILTLSLSGIHIVSGELKDEFLQTLQEYDIVVPARVTEIGHHLTYEINPRHSLRRRSVDSNVQSDDNIHYNIKINNENHILRLRHNKNLIAPSLVIERMRNRFKNVTDSTFKFLEDSKKNCHFHGDISNQPGTKAAVGLCNGMQGFIHTKHGEYFIEPLDRSPSTPEGHHRHVIYKRTALPAHLDPVQLAANIHRRESSEDDSCGVKEFANANKQRERWEQHHRRKKSTKHHRSKRSFSTERYVETLVVVDHSMIKYHNNEDLDNYVLTVMNMVATMFHDATVGNSISIVLVRILLMEEDQKDLNITHHADKTLQSFCKFQKKINFKDDDHPNHHDVAILLTRKNICSRLNEPCGTLGLAQVSGMCQPHRSCSISEDTGLALAYTVTHELGHNFGMLHDGASNGCEDPPGKQLFIMSPSLVADSITKSWSNCSKKSITQFIDRDWGYCLDDEPTSHSYEYPVMPPGTMYDANHQCRLQYGSDDAEICTNEQDVCSNLWCKTDNRCSTHLEAAAEGTICGKDKDKWCFEGKCVKIGYRPEAINGEWGEWTSWTGCTRTCGGGVSHSQRHCENPAPSHGGKYCLGERKRFRICNTEQCKDNEITFNEAQCSEFNLIPYKDSFYEWEHVPTSETPCQLHCKPKQRFFSVLMKDIVTDGTPCTAGTRNMCISGRCRHIGCDYVIDSKAREDRCGVCHGDGSTCTTIKSQFNESQGLGYVEAAVIPEGARNIRVEEVAAASNFLALQNAEGEYYLNGHWFIQWSGDYKAAGTTVQYKREGNKESVVATGPLKEPLHVMLLLQSDNPGVVFEYTVPKDNVTEPRKPEFHWHHQPWTHCTSSCGGGSQRSEVFCVELEAGVVDDKYCNVSTKPDDIQRVCNEHLCPARWWSGPWQHCSVTCGNNGVHHRTVICVRSLGPDEQIALDDDACAADDKPAETEACHRKDPCPGNSTWTVGEWSSCNGNPCGQKYRKVQCKDINIGCEKNAIPLSEMPCSEQPCGEYVASEWTTCTRSCGDGIQTRQVICQGAEFCDNSKKPTSQQLCNVIPCSDPSTTTTSPTSTLNENHEKIVTANENAEIVTDSSLKSTESIPNQKEHGEEIIENKVVPTSTDKIIPMHDLTSQNLESEEHHDFIETEMETSQNNDFIKSDLESQESSKDNIDKDDTQHSHQHRHHHGNTEEETDMFPQSNDIPNPNQETLVNSVDNLKNKTSDKNLETETEIDTKDTEENEYSSSTVDDFNPAKDISKLSKLSNKKYELPPLTNLDNLPLLPNNKELPSLPNMKDLPPLPNLDELPPINSAEFDKLPKLSNLPSFDSLPPLPGKGPLPITMDKSTLNTDINFDLHETTDLDKGNIIPEDISLKGSQTIENLATEEDISELPGEDNIQKTNTVYNIGSENLAKINMPSIPDVHINFTDTKNENQNITLSEGDSLRLSKMTDNGPFLPRVINTNQATQYKWNPLDWTECSRQCGGGIRTRVVECINSESNEDVDQTLCDINTKPNAIGDCNKDTCHEWESSEWSQCSATCGKSIRTRVVSCPQTGSCDPKHKPDEEEMCDVPKCVIWVSGQWSKCTKQCDTGEQFRLVQCVNVTNQLPSHGCSYPEKPEEKQDCNTDPCKNDNAALSLRCEYNDFSYSLCRALRRMGQCHKRFIALKCCKTCGMDSHKRANKDRPRGHSLR
ncbi:A disintegrin and metalloproteinase with thrombospondin motifs 7-like isoform X2 [Ruditapes philippinarum]|uniref:A disintegrin and metalloproteinase with thrombospondin motifs 7-like isoform X2 n=1 Tax=Ruditapes philippinarum TaxID=129788 RepID=UPI00295B71B8|nr:A disintegrin and metalloproteinase with thrombospondin motifs 7-like isoform X2 [Ruditapes philippinarum]XP_060601181.1 A disintegrin and metalloproteinase with thrombospondin motifs 7-like isoform X2 [Ruditapes philippinarum]